MQNPVVGLMIGILVTVQIHIIYIYYIPYNYSYILHV